MKTATKFLYLQEGKYKLVKNCEDCKQFKHDWCRCFSFDKKDIINFFLVCTIKKRRF